MLIGTPTLSKPLRGLPRLATPLLAAALGLACIAMPAAAQTPPSRAEVEELLRITDSADIMRQGFLAALAQGAASDPKLTAEERAVVVDEAGKVFDEHSAEFVELLIPLYQKYYSAEDLRVLNAFYASPTGQRMKDSMPRILQESMTTSASFTQKIMPEMTQRVGARLKKMRGDTAPAATPDAAAPVHTPPAQTPPASSVVPGQLDAP